MKKPSFASLLMFAACLAASRTGVAAPLTDADVGDADSFGKKVVWIGLAQTGVVVLADDCDPSAVGTLGPNDRCVTLAAAPASTSFDYPDLGHVTLPGKSTDTLICHWVTPLVSYGFLNTTGAAALARFTLRATYRLESAVLANPALINPLTGLPFNGGIDIVGLPTYRNFQTIADGATQSHTIQSTRTCIEGMISKSTLVNTYGLTEAQAKSFFANPVTIRAGVSGDAALVSGASIIVGTRFTGDTK
ncbi:MAG: hypothetical protein U1F58_01690 [Burkholderiales bacterium]